MTFESYVAGAQKWHDGRPLPLGVISGGFNQCLGRLCVDVLMEPVLFSNPAKTEVEVFGPLSAKVVAYGLGLKSEWVDLANAWNSGNLLWSFRLAAEASIGSQKKGLQLLTSLDTLLPYSIDYSVSLRTDSGHVYRQQFVHGRPNPSVAWRDSRDAEPMAILELEMDDKWFPTSAFSQIGVGDCIEEIRQARAAERSLETAILSDLGT